MGKCARLGGVATAPVMWMHDRGYGCFGVLHEPTNNLDRQNSRLQSRTYVTHQDTMLVISHGRHNLGVKAEAGGGAVTAN